MLMMLIALIYYNLFRIFGLIIAMLSQAEFYIHGITSIILTFDFLR